MVVDPHVVSSNWLIEVPRNWTGPVSDGSIGCSRLRSQRGPCGEITAANAATSETGCPAANASARYSCAAGGAAASSRSRRGRPGGGGGGGGGAGPGPRRGGGAARRGPAAAG